MADTSLSTEPVTRRVSTQIEAKVLAGELEAGARLNEQAMASQLGVSRGALREAIRFLESTGLVEVIPNRGAFVVRLSLAEVLHLYDVRAGLAHTAGRLLAARVSSAQLAALTAMHEEMVAASAADGLERYHGLNLKFHHALSEYAGNPRLQKMDEGISKELSLFMRRGVFTDASARRSCFEHGALLEALRQGDADGAAKAFVAHILTGKQRMLDTISL